VEGISPRRNRKRLQLSASPEHKADGLGFQCGDAFHAAPRRPICKPNATHLEPPPAASTLVIPFLAITSILNIGLGYWLAIYLAKGSALAVTKQADAANLANIPTGGAATAGGHAYAWPAGATAAAAGAIGQPLAGTDETKSGHAAIQSAAPGEQTQAHDQPSAMEQDLLAGIEEFRNQLAQLKSKGAFEPPVAAS
jgi:hypothetical protein